MDFPRGQDGLSDHEAERLLSGRGGSDEDAPLAALLDELRVAGSAQPSDALRERHLTAIRAAEGAAARRESAAVAAGPRRWLPLRERLAPGTRRAQVALAGAALLLAMPASAAGLATAGVTLPEGVNAPFQALGVELPNQSRADEVLTIIEATPPAERGCVFGIRVATAASDGRAVRADTPRSSGACGEAGGERGSGPEGRGAAGAPGRAGGESTAREARRGMPAEGAGPAGGRPGGGGAPAGGSRDAAPPAPQPAPSAPRPGPQPAPQPAPSRPGDGGSGEGGRAPQPQPQPDDYPGGGGAGGSARPDGAGSSRAPAPSGERP